MSGGKVSRWTYLMLKASEAKTGSPTAAVYEFEFPYPPAFSLVYRKMKIKRMLLYIFKNLSLTLINKFKAEFNSAQYLFSTQEEMGSLLFNLIKMDAAFCFFQQQGL